MSSSEKHGVDPVPDSVVDLESLSHERLRVRAALGTVSNRMSIDRIVRAVGMNRTQRSTVGNYLAGRTLPPLDILNHIVVALGATTDEQRRWNDAWYRVYDSRRQRFLDARSGSSDNTQRDNTHRGDRSSKSTDLSQKPYDLAVSFAGEQRAYVSRTVEACKALGLTIYSSQTQFFVPFISAEYLAKPIPMDEFSAAMMTAVKHGNEYVLPVLMDDVRVRRPGPGDRRLPICFTHRYIIFARPTTRRSSWPASLRTRFRSRVRRARRRPQSDQS